MIETVFRFCELANEDIRQCAAKRFGLLNAKAEDELKQMKVDCDNFSRQLIDEWKSEGIKFNKKQIDDSSLEMRSFVPI